MGEQTMNGIRQYIGMLLSIVRQQAEQLADFEKKLAISDAFKYVFNGVVCSCVLSSQLSQKTTDLHCLFIRKEYEVLKNRYEQLLGEKLEGLDVHALEQIETLQLDALRKVKVLFHF
jgi:hypothetical protein